MTHKLSCDSHPKRTEFDCYRCGFEQADYYKQQRDDLRDAVNNLFQSGEFATWLEGKDLPFAAAGELEELYMLMEEQCSNE